jgi:tetratricopeptide (TPR) repeat protein
MPRSSLRWPVIVVALLALAAQTAVAQEPPSPLKIVQQGRRLNANGKQAEALALYERALRRDPDLFDAHLAAGIALDLLGRYQEARTHLARAIELAPPEAKVAALNAMAVSHAFEGDANAGAPFYQQAFDLRSGAGRLADAAEEANALGRLYLEAGDTVNAHRWYQTGYETSRRQPDEPASSLDLFTFRWLHAQARIAARAHRADEARVHVASAKALVAATPSLSDQGPTLAYLEGYVALYLDDSRGALKALAAADQSDPFILMLEARAREATGDKAGARAAWAKVLTLNGHSLQNAFARPSARKALGR